MNQQIEPKKTITTVWIIFFTVVVTGFIVGMSVFLWQSAINNSTQNKFYGETENLKKILSQSEKQNDELQLKISELQDQISLLQQNDSEEAYLQPLVLSSVCIIMGTDSWKIGSDGYNLKREIFISESENYFEKFEQQLIDLAEKEDMLIERLCQAGSSYAFLGYSVEKGDNIIGGFSRSKKQINIKRLPDGKIYSIEGFVDDGLSLILTGGSGYAETSCHNLQKFLFNFENLEFKKIKDCEGCDEIEDGKPYSCSLDIFADLKN